MRRVKDELGMSIATEVASPAHARAALDAGMDVLWVGARTVVNPFAVQDLAEAIGGWDVPVLVKNPVNPDLELWLGALERLNACGVKRLGAIHRGSLPMARNTTAIPPCGIFLSSCIAVSPSFLCFVTRATLPVAAIL